MILIYHSVAQLVLQCQQAIRDILYAHASTAVRYACENTRLRNTDRCPSPQYVNEDTLTEYVDALLRRLLSASDPAILTAAGDAAAETAARQLEHVERTIADLDARMRRTVLRLSETDDPTIAAPFNDVLQDLSTQRKAAEKARDTLLAAIPSEDQQRGIRQSIDELRTLGIDAFWQQPPMRINQLLYRLFGPRRAVIVRDGQPVGIGRAPQRAARPRRS